MSEKLFDSHAHYYDDRFLNETEQGADALLAELFASDLGYVVNVGTNNENNPKCLDFASRYEGMYAAVGIHPGDCSPYGREAMDDFRAFLAAHSDFEKHKIVAIGEIGLDYYWEPYDKEHQQFFFREQMKLAEETGLPVVIHDREAHGDCFDIAMEFSKVRGVFHSYSGSAEMAKELLKHGWLISFSGVVTFKNARKVKEVAEIVPLDRMLIETDCPYLAPHPMRGKLNHSGYLKYTAQALAEIKGASLETVIEQTAKNAKSFFGIQ